MHAFKHIHIPPPLPHTHMKPNYITQKLDKTQKALNKNTAKQKAFSFTESDKAQKLKVDTFGKTNISKQNRNVCWSLCILARFCLPLTFSLFWALSSSQNSERSHPNGHMLHPVDKFVQQTADKNCSKSVTWRTGHPRCILVDSLYQQRDRMCFYLAYF